MKFHQQPLRYKIVGDNSSGTLVGSWCHIGCDTYLSDSGGANDMTPFVTARSEEYNTFWADGNSDYLRAAVANFRSTDSAGTIELWFKIDAVGASRVLFGSFDEASNTSFFDVRVQDTGYIAVNGYGATSNRVRGNTTVVAGEWHHAVFVSDGSAYSLYLDGAAETLTVDVGTNTGYWFADIANRDCLVIGAYSILAGTGYYFNGEITGVNVYSEAKSAQWVAARYEQAIPDDTLRFSVQGDGLDHSRYQRAFVDGGDTNYGPVLVMDGTGDYLESVDVVTGILGGWTTAFWFRSRVDGQYQLVGNTETATRRSVVAVYAGGEIRAGHWQGAVYRTASGFGAGAGVWHHIFASFDGDETTIATIDGVQITDTTDPGSGNAARIAIGASTSGSDKLDGDIDDIRYYRDSKTLAWAVMDYRRTAAKYAAL